VGAKGAVAPGGKNGKTFRGGKKYVEYIVRNIIKKIFSIL